MSHLVTFKSGSVRYNLEELGRLVLLKFSSQEVQAIKAQWLPTEVKPVDGEETETVVSENAIRLLYETAITHIRPFFSHIGITEQEVLEYSMELDADAESKSPFQRRERSFIRAYKVDSLKNVYSDNEKEKALVDETLHDLIGPEGSETEIEGTDDSSYCSDDDSDSGSEDSESYSEDIDREDSKSGDDTPAKRLVKTRQTRQTRR